MKCSEFEQWLQQYMDGGNAAVTVDVECHEAECARCRELHQAAELLEVGLQARVVPSVPVGLAARVVRDVHASRRRRFVVRYGIAMAAAAAVMLIVLPLVGFWLPGNDANRKSVVNVQPPPKPHVEDPDPPVIKSNDRPNFRKNVNKASQAVAALTNRLADRTREQAGLFWKVATTDMSRLPSLPSTSAVDRSFDPAAKTLQTTGAGVTSGFQPVADSARQALRFFVGELPDWSPSKSIQ